MVEKSNETFLTLFIIGNRRLFGSIYSGLLPDYFYEMPRESGVLICPVAKTELLFHGQKLPGDIDLIVIPYERDTLILDKTMAVEIKIIRASYNRQDKSPNEFGYSQCRSLLKLGFPYVSLVHIIVSDRSPEDTWEDVPAYRIINDQGEAESAGMERMDTMPWRLIERAFGRLTKNAGTELIGLSATYVDTGHPKSKDNTEINGFHFPLCKKCQENPNLSESNMSILGNFFEKNSHRFFMTPRFDAN